MRSGGPCRLVGLLGFRLPSRACCVVAAAIKPSNERIWADDVAQMTSGTRHGQSGRAAQCAQFRLAQRYRLYASAGNRSYDLERLDTVDLITVVLVGTQQLLTY